MLDFQAFWNATTTLFSFQTEVNLTKWVNRVDSSELLKQANMVLHGSEGYEDSDLGNVNVYIVK